MLNECRIFEYARGLRKVLFTSASINQLVRVLIESNDIMRKKIRDLKEKRRKKIVSVLNVIASVHKQKRFKL